MDKSNQLSKEYFQQEFTSEKQLLRQIRKRLIDGTAIEVPEQLSYTFKPKISQIYITLFQSGIKKIRWGARRNSISKTINRVIEKLVSHQRFNQFDIDKPEKTRILFEMVTELDECNIRNLTISKFSKDRFEAGITGYKYIYNDITRYFMPTDAITHSILSVNQLLNFLSKQTGHAKQTNSIKARAHLMRHEPIEYKKLESVAFITSQDSKQKDVAIPLYRGYPMPINFNKQVVYDSMLASVDWLIENMNDDGSFLYFYDGIKETKVDLDHPRMIAPLYNNILRHSGGTISLLRAYESSGEEKYLTAAKKAIDFFTSTFHEHEVNSEYACYPFFNRKSKLGGAGIGLVSLIHYVMHSGDNGYQKQIEGLVRHIISRVASDGEMIGYFVHPNFYSGKPLTMDKINKLSLEDKKQLFSFYYPGEALLGLALFYRHINTNDPNLKPQVKEKSIAALDFLVDLRPERYAELFLPLPADAWLMQAIEEWVKVEGCKKKSYIDFVFNDTQQMFDHMYTEENSPWFDYEGGFYYYYGDSVYHDASRCEGIVAAYHLAKSLGEEERADKIMTNMLKSAKGLMYTRHTLDSMYAHQYPEKSLNSFRFKLTRQWVRVDSVQHTSCFFARLLPLIDENSFTKLNAKSDKKQKKTISELIIGKKIGKGGFGEVFLSKDDKGNTFALKKVFHSRYIQRLEQEVKSLRIMNQYEEPLLFHYSEKQKDNFYFVFDYAEGGNLKRYVDKKGILNEEELLFFIREMLKILVHAKKNNLLHLDIKPANILCFNNSYWLADWGLSQFGKTVSTIHLKGNPIYLAPEIYYGERSFSSEIYSLGCTLYYLATGKAVFELDNKTDDFIKIFSHVYLFPNLEKITSKKIQYLLLRMMDKKTESRASVEEILLILNDEVKIPNKIDWPNIYYSTLTDPLSMLKILAKDKVPYAQERLGRIYKQGKEEQDINMEKAYKLFKEAANSNLASGQCSYGLLFYNGDFVEQNFSESFLWLEKSAMQGHDKAQYFLAKQYEYGQGIKVDLDKAIYWYSQSAKNAYKKAYTSLTRLNQDMNSLYE